jgi:hypothetical protein
MSTLQAIFSLIHSAINDNPSVENLQTLSYSSTGPYADTEYIADDGYMDMQERIRSGPDSMFFAVAPFAFASNLTQFALFLINFYFLNVCFLY